MTDQPTARRWRAQPLFISSTFRDMQAERDHLHDEVFPALEEWLRGYRTLLEPLDLRWGVETGSEAEAEDKEQIVLKVCLDGIVECRPYLIVLLGDRYGWQPPAERLTDTASEHGFSPDEVDGMSVTALEIEAGVLGDAEQAPRSLVYLRAPLPYNQMPEELRPVYSDIEAGNTDAAKRLEALKERLRREAQVNVTRDYGLAWDSERRCPTSESLRAWGEQVLADLKAALAADVEAHVAQAGELTWRDEEAFELEAFVEQRARTFVGRDATIREAEALAFGEDGQGSPWAALYTGKAGAGKSALIAELDRRWQRGEGAGNSEQNPVVLAHAAGISPRSARITPMLRRWIGELAAIQGIEEPISDGDDHESVVAAFLDLVTAVAKHRRVVLLVDAINQFEAQAWQDQSWVPAARPNIRLIATAIPGAATQRLLAAHAGVESRELPPLQTDEAGEIAAALCARYRKTLADTVLEALKHHPSAGNALWLRMAIDELLLLDADDFEQAQQRYSDHAPDAQIPAYMQHLVNDVFPTDVPGLYGYMLEGLEERFGTETVQAFAVALALSRSGWREQGLRALVKRFGGSWNDAVGASLRRAFRLHLIRHGDPPAWDFFHPIAREAVLERYPVSQEERQRQHATIAAYLAGLPDDDPIAARELMHHLIEADAIPTAAAFYCQLAEDHPAQMPATESIAERVIEGEDNAGLLRVKRLLDEAAHAPEQWLELPNKLMFHVLERVQENAPVSTTRSMMACIQQWYVDHEPAEASNRYLCDLSISHDKLASFDRSAGKPEAARSHYEQAMAICEDLHDRIGSTDTARNLAFKHIALGNLDQAGEEEWVNLAGSMGRKRAARLHYERARVIFQDLYERIDSADTARDLVAIHYELADLEGVENNPEAARPDYEQAMAINQDLHERIGSTDTARGLAVSHERLGYLEAAAVNPNGARLYYERAVAIRKDLHERIPSVDTARDLSGSYSQLGEFECATGNLGAARSHYEQAMAINTNLHERIGNTNTAQYLSATHAELGDLELAAGNFEAARSHYERMMAISQDLHDRIQSVHTASHLYWSHKSLGVLEREAGNPEAAGLHEDKAWALLGNSGGTQEEARSYYEDIVAVRRNRQERIGSADSACDLAASIEKLGDFEDSAGMTEEARAHYKEVKAIRQDLYERMDSADTARDLADSYERLGDLEREAGNRGVARSYYQQLIAIWQDRYERVDSADTARNLANSYERLGNFDRAEGNLMAARLHHREEVAIHQDLHKRIESADTACELAGSLRSLGSLERERGNLTAARSHYKEEAAIYQDLHERIGSVDTAEYLLFSHKWLSDFENSTGNPKDACWHYEQVTAIWRDLYERIGSVDTGCNLANSHERLGELELQEGNREAARWHYEQVIAVTHDLDKRTGSEEPPRALPVSHNRLGDLDHAMGNFRSASSHHEQAMVIFRHLHERIDSVDSAQDLSASHVKLGVLKQETGNLEAARAHYKQAIAILQDWHARIGSEDMARGLPFSYSRLGDLERVAGNPEAARAHHEQAMVIFQQLHERYSSARSARDLSVSYNRLGDLLQEAGNPDAARWHYEQLMSISQRLHQLIGSADTAWNLSLSYERLGDLEHASGNSNAASWYYEQAMAAKQDLQ